MRADRLVSLSLMTQLCECGCGLPAPISTTTDPRKGAVKGEPRRFRHGHNRRGAKNTPEHVERQRRAITGRGNHGWRGGRYIDRHGYVRVKLDADHSFAEMAYRTGYVMEHRLVMAEHLGRLLTPAETVHHLTVEEGGTGDTTDNRIELLRLFPSKAAHVAHHESLKPKPPAPNPSGLCQCGCGSRTRLADQTHFGKGWVKGEPVRFLPGHYARTVA